MTIESVIATLKERPRVSELLVSGDLNANLNQPEGDHREKEISMALTVAVLEDMSVHFLPRWRPWCQYGRMWSMVRLGREMRSRTDYIFGTYRRIFRNVAIWYPWHNSDHYMVLGCLRSSPLREHSEYLGRRTRLPLWHLIKPTR